MIAINIDGKIKTFSEYPKTWNNISPYQFSDTHYEDGFRDLVIPTLTANQKLGALIFDAANDVFTYEIIDKSAEELAQESANAKAMEAEKIKEAKIKILVEERLTVAERLAYYPEWRQQPYDLKERVTFKGKTFENNVVDNINAPDKGGWTEIK